MREGDERRGRGWRVERKEREGEIRGRRVEREREREVRGRGGEMRERVTFSSMRADIFIDKSNKSA